MTQKQKKKSSRFPALLTIVFIILIMVCAYNIYIQLKNYQDSNRLYSGLGQEYVTTSDDTEDAASGNDGSENTASGNDGSENTASGNDGSENTEDPEDPDAPYPRNQSSEPLITVDFDSLKEQNPDIIGWIYFENEDLSYPLLYSGDNSTYLHTTPDGKSATAGSIFVEGSCSPDLNDAHTIIYGHNMRNLSMFGKLKYYYRDSDYYDSHQYFQIATEEGTHRYRIFAYEVIDTGNFVYTTGYAHDEAFADFIDQIEAQSLIKSPVTVTVEDSIITLSTCTSGDGRFVVHGVRVE